jgi:3-methyladenine DNA glycosylase AlkD
MHANEVLHNLFLETNRTPEQLKTATPNRKPSIGVRFPRLVEIAKQIQKNNPIEFLESNDCSIYELEILQTYLIGFLKDFNQAILYFNKFALIACEWSTVDSLCQHFTIAKKYPNEVFALLGEYVKKNDEYRQRIVAVMILSHFLNDAFIEESILLLDQCVHPGYYTKMAVAWAIATMMVRYSDLAIAYLKQNRLDLWTHNKAIQKTQESFRVAAQIKAKVRELKRV